MASKLCANIQNYEKACWEKLHGKGHMALPRLAWPVESNELFVVMEKRRANELQGSSGIIFYEWIVPDLPMDEHCFSIDEANGEGLFRLVTSWSTTEEEVDMFSSILLPAASNWLENWRLTRKGKNCYRCVNFTKLIYDFVIITFNSSCLAADIFTAIVENFVTRFKVQLLSFAQSFSLVSI